MSYVKSFQDSLLDSLAPIKRKLSNIRTHYLGTKAQVLRVRQVSQNAFGGKTFEYNTEIIDNVVITYPFSSVEMFNSKTVNDTTSIDLLQYLPITMVIPFDDIPAEDYISGSAVMVNEDDLIIQILYGHHEEKIPIVMKVSRGYASFSGRNIVKRRYDLTLQRGQMEDEIQDLIDEYISGSSL